MPVFEPSQFLRAGGVAEVMDAGPCCHDTQGTYTGPAVFGMKESLDSSRCGSRRSVCLPKTDYKRVISHLALFLRSEHLLGI